MAKTILTIFAGREQYLEILKIYLDKLIEQNIIDEVHLWDYTRNKKDSEYISKLCNANSSHYKLFIPKLSKIRKWIDYYKYYAKANYNDQDIIIKCDDDVVYIDINRMQDYLLEVKEGCLYYPNIINNDVCAYFQTKNKVHRLLEEIDLLKTNMGNKEPLTQWYESTKCADDAHKIFLKNQNKFILEIDNIKWGSRLSINMFAGRFKTIKTYYSKFIRPYVLVGDEAFFSAKVCKIYNRENIIVPFFNIVHFAFGPQDVKYLEKKYLQQYMDLALKSTG